VKLGIVENIGEDVFGQNVLNIISEYLPAYLGFAFAISKNKSSFSMKKLHSLPLFVPSVRAADRRQYPARLLGIDESFVKFLLTSGRLIINEFIEQIITDSVIETRITSAPSWNRNGGACVFKDTMFC